MKELTWWDKFLDFFWGFTRWFSKWWWQYLFEKKNGDQSFYEISRLKIILCKIKGHPNGYIFYNPGGYEPDYHCKDCYEELI